MRPRPTLSRALLFAGCGLTLGAAAGCGDSQSAAAPAPAALRYRTVHPQRRDIRRTVGQPAYIDAYEQTSIYPKLAGYIDKWFVDIGDKIRKGQDLAKLFVPELDAEYEQRTAQVAVDEAAIELARQRVRVAEQKLIAASAQTKQAEADLGRYQSAVDRWTSEVQRLTKMVAQKVVDKQVLDESQKQLNSNVAQRQAAEAGIAATRAVEMTHRIDIDKARADVRVAEAQAAVGRADQERYAALVSYLSLTAPYDGVVVARNANTGDFVQPAGGDKSVERAPTRQDPVHASPIYVVARTDRVRVFIDVPELDANYVRIGTPARIQVQALGGADLEATVTRTSWALNVQTRTLRAEVDLPNADSRLLPGMYAYARLIIDRPNVMAVPAEAVTEIGNRNYCYLLEGGRPTKTAVQVGPSDGAWIEVSNKLLNGDWTPFTGQEPVVMGDLTEFGD